MALTLIRPDLDIWEPGEHNGTFRGNNLAFVTAAEALRYWETERFAQEIAAKGEIVHRFLLQLVAEYPQLRGEVRGRGLMQGIAFSIPGLADEISKAAFAKGLIMETSGTDSEVAKIMPPLTIDEPGLAKGLDILRQSMREAAAERDTSGMKRER